MNTTIHPLKEELLYDDTKPNIKNKVYFDPDERSTFAYNLDKELGKGKLIKEGNQCLKEKSLLQYIRQIEPIGKGSFANVVKGCVKTDKNKCDNEYTFAIKIGKISKNALKYMYDETIQDWHELLILQKFQSDIKSKNITFLPLLIDYFICNNCRLLFKKNIQVTKNNGEFRKLTTEKTQSPCQILILELAEGDLNELFKETTLSKFELEICLFQIMVAVHSIQHHYSIINADIKSKNILYYEFISKTNHKPNDYFEFIILGQSYFVPVKDMKYIFILNDFGVSYTFASSWDLKVNPKSNIRVLGSRYAMCMYKNNSYIFSPLDCSKYDNGYKKTNNYKQKTKFNDIKNIQWYSDNNNDEDRSWGCKKTKLYKENRINFTSDDFTKEQLDYMKKHGIPNSSINPIYYDHPSCIPPFEFYNDIQDVIRMFIGGERSIQFGSHIEYKYIQKIMKKSLRPYLGKARNHYENLFSKDPSQIIAGVFIESYFSKNKRFTSRPTGKKINTFTISNKSYK